MSHYLTQPEEIDLVLMNPDEYGVEGMPDELSAEIIHDCDGSAGVIDITNRESDSNSNHQGETS